MMQSAFGMYVAGALPPSYPYDELFDSTYTTTTTTTTPAPTATATATATAQTASSQAARRPSRGSTGQRAGTSSMMRVVKPSSANNSPRSHAVTARRRTLMSDSQTVRRHQQVMEYLSKTTQDVDAVSPNDRQSRPVSWHPSSTYHLQAPPFHHYLPPPQQQQQQQHQQPQTTCECTTSMCNNQQDIYYAAPQYSPATASYSNNTSPSSTFSPLPTSYQAVETTTALPSDDWQAAEEKSTFYFPPLNDPFLVDHPPLSGITHDRASADGLDWNSFILHGFDGTSPPTPDSFVQTTQQPQHAASEAAIQAFDDEPPEEDGEVLVGMGLYDTPDKHEDDPHLNNYRSTVTSLLGSSFRTQEPKGKGLKLEETWEPPKSDDEDDDEENNAAEDNF